MFFEQLDKNSGSGTCILNILHVAGHIAGSVRMVVVEVDLNAGIGKTFLQPVNPAGLSGVDNDKAGHCCRVNVFDFFKVILVADFLRQKISYPSLLGPGKDQFRIRI